MIEQDYEDIRICLARFEQVIGRWENNYKMSIRDKRSLELAKDALERNKV